MRKSQNYELLDSGNLEKLESINGYRIIRPCPVALWSRGLKQRDWDQASLRFQRNSEGGGEWLESHGLGESEWPIEVLDYRLQLKRTSFGHLGIFPEQWENWQLLNKIAKNYKARDKECRILNLFAYTGGATLACASGGASVTHLDASKISVNWARENASLSGLGEAAIRWIVDDVSKFVTKELKRGVIYDGVILDPPTYGRGPKNQMWKIEKDLGELLQSIFEILNPALSFVMLSSHSQGHSPLALSNILQDMGFGQQAQYTHSEMTIGEVEGRRRKLPSGATSFVVSEAIDFK